MSWFILASAIVYLCFGAWYALRHPEDTLLSLEKNRVLWTAAGLGALIAMLWFWPLFIRREN